MRRGRARLPGAIRPWSHTIGSRQRGAAGLVERPAVDAEQGAGEEPNERQKVGFAPARLDHVPYPDGAELAKEVSQPDPHDAHAQWAPASVAGRRARAG